MAWPGLQVPYSLTSSVRRTPARRSHNSCRMIRLTSAIPPSSPRQRYQSPSRRPEHILSASSTDITATCSPSGCVIYHRIYSDDLACHLSHVHHVTHSLAPIVVKKDKFKFNYCQPATRRKTTDCRHLLFTCTTNLLLSICQDRHITWCD